MTDLNELESAEDIMARINEEKSKDNGNDNNNNKPDNELDRQPNSESELEQPEEQEEDLSKLSHKEFLQKAFDACQDPDEKKAFRNGWRPEKFFKGKNKDGSKREWVDAKTFLNKTNEALPVANERIKELTKQIEEAQKLAQSTEKRLKDAEKKGYEKALKQLEVQQEEAVELGDSELFKKLKQEERDIYSDINKSNEKPVEATPVVEESFDKDEPQITQFTPQEQQVLKNWIAENNWFNTDARLKAYAIESEKQLIKEKPFLSLQDRLEVVKEEVTSFFYKKNTPRTPTFETSNRSGTGNDTPQQKSYSELPDLAKKNCDYAISARNISGDAVKEFRNTYAKQYYQLNQSE